MAASDALGNQFRRKRRGAPITPEAISAIWPQGSNQPLTGSDDGDAGDTDEGDMGDAGDYGDA